MQMPWNPDECAAGLESYFARFILPPEIVLRVNGVVTPPRPAAHTVEAVLTTESFNAGRWQKLRRRTRVNLVPAQDGEEPLIHEMGIPVCPVEWDQPFHVDVAQRVPMNPCRDAVMSGYPASLHRACLPALLPEMDSESARATWVGDAAAKLAPDIQDRVLQTAFGENLARSTPGFGAYSPDEDAREKGVTVLDTRQLQGGFRDIARQRLESTKFVVDQIRRQQQADAEQAAIDLDAPAPDAARAIAAAGGIDRVRAVLSFAEWFCNEILHAIGSNCRCRARAGFLPNAIATWTYPAGILTLDIQSSNLWRDILATEFIAVLLHEVAHQRAAHHGLDFLRSIEECAGHACRIIFNKRDQMAARLENLPALPGPKLNLWPFGKH